MNHIVVNKLRRVSPALLLLSSCGLVILSGMVLLMLPISRVSGEMKLIDALFTAASAACVTSLIVVDTGSHFRLAGQGVILALIRTGGTVHNSHAHRAAGVPAFTCLLLRVDGEGSAGFRYAEERIMLGKSWQDARDFWL